MPACYGSEREFLDSDVFNITPGTLRRFSGTCETLFISVASSRQTFPEV